MQPATLAEKWTYRDMLERLPPESRYELRANQLLEMSPAPSGEHQKISKRLFRLLDRFVTQHHLGEVDYAPFDVRLDENNVVQPDILFIAQTNTGQMTRQGFEGVPDLLVEIISPSSHYRDTFEKKADYERFGVLEYWLVDPANRVIEVFTLREGQYQLHSFVAENGTALSALLPGFEAPSGEVFG
ncbi:MAG: Uma2 family endonuclease [Cytophagaceae bacterium]|nr:Uma2 family endonuclease [Cytophagaceae bacterium]